jgi:hypothetical protein
VSIVAADAAGAFTTVNSPAASVINAAVAAASHRRVPDALTLPLLAI